MRRITLVLLVLTAALAGGCTGSGTAYYSGGGTLTATTVAPDLVYVSPGVQVVADYEYPVFYSDNYYWRYDGGRWYRSSWYTGGWIYATPPHAVMRIDRPYAYRHYRPSGYVARRQYRDTRAPVYRDTRVYRDGGPVYRDHRTPVYQSRPPVYRESAPVIRDHRTHSPPVYRNAPRPAPVVRDHRAPRSEGRPVVRDHRDHDHDRRVRR